MRCPRRARRRGASQRHCAHDQRRRQSATKRQRHHRLRTSPAPDHARPPPIQRGGPGCVAVVSAARPLARTSDRVASAHQRGNHAVSGRVVRAVEQQDTAPASRARCPTQRDSGIDRDHHACPIRNTRGPSDAIGQPAERRSQHEIRRRGTGVEQRNRLGAASPSPLQQQIQKRVADDDEARQRRHAGNRDKRAMAQQAGRSTGHATRALAVAMSIVDEQHEHGDANRARRQS